VAPKVFNRHEIIGQEEMTDENLRRRAALLEGLRRKAPSGVRVTTDNLLTAADLVRDDLAEPLEIADVLYVRLTMPLAD
jgi:hypothetical protein